jgi:hypothetical protein
MLQKKLKRGSSKWSVGKGLYEEAIKVLGKIQPHRNESISALLKAFTDKQSGLVAETRAELRERFDKQSFQTQRKILQAMLSASKQDRVWAYKQLSNGWDDFFFEDVMKDKRFTEKLFGKPFADRGYVSQDLFEMLFVDDLHLVTKIKKNMKNSLMLLKDKLMLRKRSVIETVNDELKNVCQIEHTRHRSVDNFVTNLIAGLIAYNLLPKKPQMNIEIIDKSRLITLNS